MDVCFDFAMSAGNSRGAYMRECKKRKQKKIIVIMYPNEQSYIPNDSVNIEKHKLICEYIHNYRKCNLRKSPGK
jgi:hypothetical protein